MGILGWLVVGSAGVLVALTVLAVVCACVLASRADDAFEAFEGLVDPGFCDWAPLIDWHEEWPS